MILWFYWLTLVEFIGLRGKQIFRSISCDKKFNSEMPDCIFRSIPLILIVIFIIKVIKVIPSNLWRKYKYNFGRIWLEECCNYISKLIISQLIRLFLTLKYSNTCFQLYKIYLFTRKCIHKIWQWKCLLIWCKF